MANRFKVHVFGIKPIPGTGKWKEEEWDTPELASRDAANSYINSLMPGSKKKARIIEF